MRVVVLSLVAVVLIVASWQVTSFAQYLAVTTGQGGFHAASYAILVPELVSPPDRSAMLWVFELP